MTDHVKGMNEAMKQAEAGLALFKLEEETSELDVDGAMAFKAKIDEQIKKLDEEAAQLNGKDNKKARTEKGKESAALKNNHEYIDACKVVKGLQPAHGHFAKKTGGLTATKSETVATEAADKKAAEKKEKDKPKKAMESAGISKAERDELEKLKNDIIERKKALKEQGMSGGQINKDEQVAAWVARMNELKEKECPGSASAGKKDDKKDAPKKKLSADQEKQLADLEKEFEEYRQKLLTEFKYSKKEIAADPDMVDYQAKINKLKGKK